MIETFAALADNNRLRIFESLRVGTKSVGEIAGELELRQPQVSKHLAVLKSAGLVEVQRDAQRRIYQIRPTGMKNLDSWLEGYRVLWDERFKQLDSALSKLIDQKASGYVR